MAQLVFVHGVATRGGPGHAEAVASRDALFRSILFKGGAVDIRSPLWGDHVPAIDRRVFETDGGVQSFSLGAGGLGAGMGGGLSGVADPAPAGLSLSDVAAGDQVAALDALFVELIDRAEADGRALSPDEVDAFARATDEVVAERPTLLRGAASDEAIAARLTKGGVGSFGVLDPIRAAAEAISDRLRNTVSTIGFGAVRDRLSPAVALFLGDVLVYLRDGGLRERIRAEVRGALTAAHAAAGAGGGPLVVIGHSLGGVILCDMLLDPASGLPPGLRIDALVTVGSQPGLFQSVGALSPRPAGGGRVPRPAPVRHWLNVFDPIDPLAFTAASAFDGVEDLAFDSVTGLISAHTTYFKRPQFYARCHARLAGFGLA